MPNLVDYINSTNDCRKAIINKLNNKLNSFIPEISIDTPLSEIDEKLNNININNRLIHNTTYYVIRGYNQPGTNLINCIDPRLDNIETSVWNTGSWAKFRYIGKYPIKASAIVSFESSSTDKPYLKIEDKDGNIKTYIEAVSIYEFKFIDDIVLNQYDTVTMRTNGGNSWNAITSITLNDLNKSNIIIKGNNTSNDISEELILNPGKYRIGLTAGGGSGAGGYQKDDRYLKSYNGGNGSSILCDIEVLNTVKCNITLGRAGGSNIGNLPYIGQSTKNPPVHISGNKIPGGNSSLSINGQNVLSCPGGGAVTIKNGNTESYPGIQAPTYISSIDSLINLTNIKTFNSTNQEHLQNSNLYGIFGNDYGWSGKCIASGWHGYTGSSNGKNPTGGAICIVEL